MGKKEKKEINLRKFPFFLTEMTETPNHRTLQDSMVTWCQIGQEACNKRCLTRYTLRAGLRQENINWNVISYVTYVGMSDVTCDKFTYSIS